MASFQAKIDWERLGKRENKKNRSDEFLPYPEWGIPKKLQKVQKSKKRHCGFFLIQNRLGIALKEKIKKSFL